MEAIETSTTSARDTVLGYLAFFKSRSTDFEQLRKLLAPSLRFASPLGQFQDADSFLRDLARDALAIEEVRVRKIIVDGNSACALYDVKSKNVDIGTVAITEWFELRDGRIESITSTHDASSVRTLLSRI